MTQEHKELLIKDLCARLPYGVKVKLGDNPNIFDLEYRIKFAVMYGDSNKLEDILDIINIKPYLFPLSSMTEEQAKELFDLFEIDLLDSVGADYIKINEITGITFFLNKGFDVETHLGNLIDWFSKNHLDWRGLIPLGLALDASGLNIY
jgi:hypothetical protein